MVPTVTQNNAAASSIVIIGLGMVGLSFIEKILEYDSAKKYTITAICEEPLGKSSHSTDLNCVRRLREYISKI